MLILDSNTISYYFRGDPLVVPRLQALRPTDVGVPAIVEYELRYGLTRLPPDAAAPRLAALSQPFQAEIARAAAEWRRGVETIADGLAPVVAGVALVIKRSALAPFDRSGLSLLWPALGARIGVTLDRRGTERLARFTLAPGDGGSIPLAGGSTVERTIATFVMRPPHGSRDYIESNDR